MPYRLFKYRVRLAREYSEPRMFRSPERLRDSYEVVIIGGGGHGLAAAHYLAHEHGIRDVAVLEQRYIGHGGTGRNTAIIRSNYLTEEGARFYQFSVDLYRDLSRKLDYNLFYSERGTLPWLTRRPRCAPSAGAPRSTSTSASIPRSSARSSSRKLSPKST